MSALVDTVVERPGIGVMMSRFLLLTAMLGVLAVPPASAQPASGTSCVGLSPPVDAEVLRIYQPTGRYSGHWGIDFEDGEAQPVRAAAHGRVTFAGTVAGNLTVSVDHGGGLRTSYSFLDEAAVATGQRVRRGGVIGEAAGEYDHGLVHFSVRRNGVYVDPEPLLGCRARGPGGAVRLVTPSS